MPHTMLSTYVFDCSVCHTRCDGKSKAVYIFEKDTVFSEHFENMIIDKINLSQKYDAAKCNEAGYPDVAVYNKNGQLSNYVEVKVQQRTFMTVKRILPESGLLPSETVALNLSDLLRYFTIFDETKIPISIVWVLLNRPCITTENAPLFFYQRIEKLREIYLENKDKRRFRRKSGEGDIVEGEHKGVTVNYHFSLKELLEWKA